MSEYHDRINVLVFEYVIREPTREVGDVFGVEVDYGPPEGYGNSEEDCYYMVNRALEQVL